MSHQHQRTSSDSHSTSTSNDSTNSTPLDALTTTLSPMTLSTAPIDINNNLATPDNRPDSDISFHSDNSRTNNNAPGMGIGVGMGSIQPGNLAQNVHASAGGLSGTATGFSIGPESSGIGSTGTGIGVGGTGGTGTSGSFSPSGSLAGAIRRGSGSTGGGGGGVHHSQQTHQQQSIIKEEQQHQQQHHEPITNNEDIDVIDDSSSSSSSVPIIPDGVPLNNMDSSEGVKMKTLRPGPPLVPSLHPRILLVVREENILLVDEEEEGQGGEGGSKGFKKGIRECIKNTVRGNGKWVPLRSNLDGIDNGNGSMGVDDEDDDDDDSEMDTEGWWEWDICFRSGLPDRQLTISPSHDDFTQVPEGERFRIEVGFGRRIEAFRGLGHILAISRALTAPFERSFHPEQSSSSDPSSSSSQQPSSSNPNADSNPNPTSSSSSQPIDIDQLQGGMGIGISGLNICWTGKVGALLRRSESCLFETIGVMIDCSRNGVLLPKSIEFLLRQMALMGSNMLQLYTEDTYQVKGEPFFGYFRGPYTQDELSAIDQYADNLGIEVIPCIQTLGHLGQVLQWQRYGYLRDTSEVLLAEYQETYNFIEKMIRTITKPLRTKRIHIGMDEAFGVSEGRYRQVFGYKEGTQVFIDHLKRVHEICQKLGLKPMIWSDMLFCLQARSNSLQGYYDSTSPATPEVVDALPKGVEYVYWDYYHTMPESYSKKIKHHWELSRQAPWVATGIWTWSRFWTALPFTIETVRAACKASKNPRLGVKHMMTTIWGDEGNEFDLWSALPGILYFSEQAYTRNDEVDVPLLKQKFDGITGGDFDDYLYASKLDDTQPESQPIGPKTSYTPNCSKWLLWEEPFFSWLSPQYSGYDLETHFNGLATYLEYALSQDLSTIKPYSAPKSVEDFPANFRLRGPYVLARILALKCHLRQRLAHAYKTNDIVELQALAGPGPESRMSRLRYLVDEMWRYHREMWMSTYKPFGWEILEIRYGTTRARLETMHWRLCKYLDEQDTEVTKIDELEVDLETAYVGQGPNLMLDWHRVSRATYI